MRDGRSATLVRASKRVAPYRLRVSGSLACAVTGVAAQLAAPVLAGRAIDEMIAGSVGVPPAIIAGLLLYAGGAAVNAAVSWAMQAINAGICARVARDLRKRGCGEAPQPAAVIS